MIRHILALALLGTLLVPACNEDEGPLMAPGDNCMTCHNGSKAPKWTVAGTVYSSPTDSALMGVDGVQVVITDAAGKKLTLTTNAAGNFYSRDSVTFPISAEVTRNGKTQKMSQTVPTGACSSCHNQPAISNAPGRLYNAG